LKYIYDKLLIILLAGALCCTTCKSWSQENTDSLKAVLNDARSDTLRFDICIDLHNAYFKTRPEESKKYADQMLRIAQKSGNKFFEYKANLALARCERKRRDYSKIIPYVKRSIALSKELKDNNLTFEAYYTLAKDYLDGEDFTSLVPALEATMQYAVKNNNELQVAKVNYVYGFYYATIDQDTRALPYFEKALKVFQERKEHFLGNACKLQYTTSALKALPPDPGLLRHLLESVSYYAEINSKVQSAYCRALIGMYYYLYGDYSQSVTNYTYARNLYKEHKNLVQYALTGLDMANALLLKGDLGSVEAIIKESEDIFRDNNYTQGNIILYITKSKYYAFQEEKEMALDLLKKVQKLLPEKEYNIYTKDYYRTLALVYYKTNDNPEKCSALFSFYQYLFRKFYTEKNIILRELLITRQDYPEMDSSLPHLINTVKDPEYFEKLHSFFEKSSSKDTGIPDSLLLRSGLSSDVDSSNLFYRELEAIDAVANKKLIRAELAKQESEKRLMESRLWFAIIITVIIAVLTILLIIYLRVVQKNKKRAERDKATIESLQVQLNHLIENNLKSISSFIDKAISSSEPGEAVESLKNRVDIIHQFHETYKKQGLKNKIMTGYDVDLQKHIENTCSYLKSFYNYDDGFLKINVGAPVTVSYNVGINLVLLISELVQNSCKYAFNDDDVDKGNIISIAVTVDNKNMLTLHYQDNGAGKPLKGKRGLGSELIEEIVRTIQAKTSEYNDNGYHFFLERKLRHNEYKKAEP